ncbi:Josephin-like protein [Platanthera guangdongensis]|uniref:ubiquitinyl hydrolase 1 n=1 Tax=Platanthera guangdongensis TaxID=2320717 RepID=A0ABR2M1S0_9ASPA
MEDKTVYHERQRLQFCLLHALNNLLQQEDSFTRAELDAISDKLVRDDPEKGKWTPLSVIFKPHHNALTGNYDVNVLIAALEARNKMVVWHDRRNDASSIDLADKALLGILINVPVRRFAGLWRSRHWISLRCVAGIWYNLDSDLAGPKPFLNLEVAEFLNHVIDQGGEVLVILDGSL